MKRRFLKVLVIAALLLAIGAMVIHVCADGGAMASAYQTCECRGWEWQLYDRTAADGPRRTLCLGLTQSRTCYQFRSGPVMACTSR